MTGSEKGYILLLVAFLVITGVAFVSCGWRGDPVAIPEYTEEVKKEIGESQPQETDDERKYVSEELRMQKKPEPPAGLRALFTGPSVILTWDEGDAESIRFYRVYRSEDKDFIIAGETVTPAYTDKNIQKGKIYFYKVTAFGLQESAASEQIIVNTGIKEE